MTIAISPAEQSRRDRETNEFNARRRATENQLRDSVLGAVKAGIDINLPSYLGSGRRQFWSISSMLVGAGREADQKLLEACSLAANHRDDLVGGALRELVEIVAKNYADDNVDEACPHPDF